MMNKQQQTIPTMMKMNHRATTILFSFLLLSSISSSGIFVAASSTTTTKQDPDRDITKDTVKNIPSFPTFRFTSWDNLSPEIRDRAHKIGYHGKTWNKPGQYEIEKLDWESLEENVRTELQGMGFTPFQWDCYMNHYRNYDWNELDDEEANLYVKDSYKTLGWTYQSWDANEAPDVEGKYWFDLTQEEADAAASICYTQALWDEVEIPLWEHDDGVGNTDTSDNETPGETDDELVEAKSDVYDTIYDTNDRSSTKNDGSTSGPGTAHNSRNIPIPMFRYNVWDELTPELQELAIKVKYNEKRWNSFDFKALESRDFEWIGTKHPEAVQALKDMGFTEEQWDCYISHYRSYDWNDLKEAGVQQYFETLGWDHKSWSVHDEPDTFDMYWPDLNEEQRNAAFELCYFRETWDEVSLQFWPRTSSNTDWKAYALAHPAKTGGAGAVLITLLIGLLFLCCWCCRPRRLPRGSNAKDNDLEMYGDEIGGSTYHDDPIDDDAHESDDAEYGEAAAVPQVI